ncbi:MAG: ATP synthase F1 subunit delta [Patescibacteria group bacterium]|jgi:F-type H+-transporting ATPase subunit delta|nr:ATP synthase F1 subunit delta [Patescibacteria group bacterium]
MKVSPKHYATALYEATENSSKEETEVLAKKFAEVVFKQGDANKTDDILRQFEKIWNEKNNIVKVEIVSAHKVGGKEIEKIKEHILKKTSAKEVEVEEVIDKKVLGGVIVRYNDYIINSGMRRKIKEFTKIIRGV